MLAGIGSLTGLGPPQMIEIEEVGGVAKFLGEGLIPHRSAASGQATFSSASTREALSASRRRCLNRRMFHDLASALSNGTFWLCRKEWKPIRPRPTERSRGAE